MSWPRLLGRHLRLSGARWAVLALVVALTSALAMAWPRWLSATATHELRGDLGAASKTFIDPSLVLGPGSAGGVVLDDNGQPRSPDEDPLTTALTRYRAGLPEPLRSTLGAPARWTTYRSLPADSPKVTDVGAMFVEPATVPQLMDHARYVAGRPPKPTDISTVATPPPAPGDESLAPPTPTLVVEIAMSSEMARTMEWSLGESRTTGDRSYAGTSVRVQLTLVGIFEPDDPTSSFWQNAGTLLHATWTENGDVGTIATGRGVVAGAANLWWMDTSASRVWFPLLTDRLDAATAPRLADQLRTDLAAVPLGADRVGTAPLSTEAPDRIDTVVARAKAAGSVLTLAVAAPAGVLLALLALAAQVVVGPRRGAHLLTALRGGSLYQHRTLLGTEAALVCLPAAAVGALAAAALVPAHVSGWWWAAPATLGVVPVLTMAAASPVPRVPRVPRVAVEAAVLVLAAAAVVELAVRGIDDSAGTDALAAVTPLLLAVLTALACARVVPLVVRPLAVRLRRRDDLVTPLGAALSARRPTPLTATVATVAGTAVALLGVLVTATLDTGRVTAAATSIGADVRVNGALDDALVAKVRDVPGVAQVAPVISSNAIYVQVDGRRVPAELFIADAGLTTVQAAVPGHLAVPPVGTVLVSSTLGVPAGARGAEIATDPATPVTVESAGGTPPGLTTAHAWVLVDARTLAAAHLRNQPDSAYVQLERTADPVAVAAAVRQAVGPDLTVTTARERLEALRSAPTTRALSLGILLVVAAGLLAAALAVALALSARSVPRTRLVAVLRTLGLPPRSEFRLVLWEVAPGVAVGVLAGVGLGFGLAGLLLACVDLRPFTGGGAQPHLTVDPLAVAAAVAVVVVVAAAAVVVSAWAAARRSATVVLRAGEDRT
jgi:putative ABC transport system permease protein